MWFYIYFDFLMKINNCNENDSLDDHLNIEYIQMLI